MSITALMKPGDSIKFLKPVVVNVLRKTELLPALGASVASQIWVLDRLAQISVQMPPKPATSTAKKPVAAPTVVDAPEVPETDALDAAQLIPDVDERKTKIKAAFGIFDPENTGSIPEEEVPTIMRYLDIFVPDKDYVERVLIDLHGDEPKPFIRYEKFEEVCIKLMDSHEYEPDGPEILLAAFRALDVDGTGFLEVDKLKSFMTGFGEPPFREKELEAFLKITVDKETGKVYYEDYVALMSR